LTVRGREALVILVVGVVAALAGYGYYASRSGAPAGEAPGGGAALAAAKLPDLAGTLQPLGQWRGKVVVVNFWATWCAPCREEIPLFVKLQNKYGERGLQFVGIAIDQPEKVRPYAAELGMNFPILIGGVDALDLTRALGNRASVLPFTVVIGRDGKIVSSEVGVAKEAKLEPLLSSLL
jgi:thiol-disulfide isomerase/thioredoxin